MLIVFIVLAVLALIGWVFVKNDELSGLGRNVQAGSLRHPHGKLVSVMPKEAIPKQAPFKDTFLKALPWICALAGIVIVIVANAIGHAAFADSIMLSALPPLLLAAESIIRGPQPVRSFTNYMIVLVGSVVVMAIAMSIASAAAFAVGVTASDIWSMPIFEIILVIACGLGAALTVACLPTRVEFERTFEDGAKRSISVSTKSAAYRAFIAIMNK